jgi:hypothetical protein
MTLKNVLLGYLKPVPHSCFIGLLLLLVGGCGKVIQEAPKPSKQPTFDITYQLPLTPSDPKNPSLAWTPDVTPIYVAVSQIDDSGKISLESSGKATIKKREIPSVTPAPTKSSPPASEYVSTSLRPDGVPLIGPSDYKWSKALLDSKTLTWSFESKKIPRGAPFYRIAVYTHPHTYKMKLIDALSVSQNATISVGSISHYDTIIAVLFTASLTHDKAVIEIPNYATEMAQFYSPDVIDALTLPLPQNTVPKFNPNTPHFMFSSPTELQLLRLYDLYRANPKEALAFIDTTPLPWLTKTGKAKLVTVIKAGIPK